MVGSVLFESPIIDVKTEGDWLIIQLAKGKELLVFDTNRGFKVDDCISRIPLPESITKESAKFAEHAHVLKNVTKRFPIATKLSNNYLLVAVPHMTIPNAATCTFFATLDAQSLTEAIPDSFEVKDLADEGF